MPTRVSICSLTQMQVNVLSAPDMLYFKILLRQICRIFLRNATKYLTILTYHQVEYIWKMVNEGKYSYNGRILQMEWANSIIQGCAIKNKYLHRSF